MFEVIGVSSDKNYYKVGSIDANIGDMVSILIPMYITAIVIVNGTEVIDGSSYGGGYEFVVTDESNEIRIKCMFASS